MRLCVKMDDSTVKLQHLYRPPVAGCSTRDGRWDAGQTKTSTHQINVSFGLTAWIETAETLKEETDGCFVFKFASFLFRCDSEHQNAEKKRANEQLGCQHCCCRGCGRETSCPRSRQNDGQSGSVELKDYNNTAMKISTPHRNRIRIKMTSVRDLCVNLQVCRIIYTQPHAQKTKRVCENTHFTNVK